MKKVITLSSVSFCLALGISIVNAADCPNGGTLSGTCLKNTEGKFKCVNDPNATKDCSSSPEEPEG